ncbi:MAG TPA: hypothetical protein PLQ93_09725 [Bacteroidia bacterium]|nr:hypothetical protein [Bacteroidia bacterium]
MSLKFNLNRPPLKDEEINKQKDFDRLLKTFREQSLKKAQSDETWRKNKYIRYTAIIGGVTAICTITLLSLQQTKKQHTEKSHEKTITSHLSKPKPAVPFVNPPAPALASRKTVFTFNAEDGAHFLLKNKSSLHIPSNALVNAAGQQISGKVSLEYKEMLDLGDALLSGIPMRYDSAGKTFYLETAGMFDIRAFQNGKPVFIKPGEKLEVKLASKNAEDRFHQYYLDTLKKNWVYIGKDNPQGLNAKTQSASNPEEKQHEKLQALQTEIEIILPARIDSVQKRYSQQAARLPQPAEPPKPHRSEGKRPVFVIDASTKDFPELEAYENTVFEVGAENRNYNKELHNITWNDVKILPGPDKGRNYLLELSYRSRTERLVVYPVLQGEDYEKALSRYEKQYNLYEQKLNSRQAQEERLFQEMKSKQSLYLAEQKRKKAEYDREKIELERQKLANQQQQYSAGFSDATNSARVERVFRISQFGIFNSDCPHPAPLANGFNPVFALMNKGNLVLPDKIYLIDHAAKTVVGYDASNALISCDSGREYSFCLFRRGQVYVCDRESFSESIEKGSKKFSVKALPERADTPEDFKKFLDI